VNFPPDIPNPISISALTGFKYDLKEMEDLMIESFRNFYQLIESGNFDSLNRQYIKKLYRFDEFSEYRADAKIFTAKIVGVTEFGHLILQFHNGDTQTFAYQEVEYILPA
jgi:BirA family biotin operon repressor/biotin-[acetyl-CoA-carboxylase] ligase